MTKTILILAIAAAFIAGSVFSVGIDYAEAKSTKLIKECDEKKPPKNDDKIKPHCESLELIRAIELTPGPEGPQGEQGPAGQDAQPTNATRFFRNVAGGFGDILALSPATFLKNLVAFVGCASCPAGPCSPCGPSGPCSPCGPSGPCSPCGGSYGRRFHCIF